jgi:molybdopterin molybdotransferase
MSQLRDGCFAFGGKLLPLAEALSLLVERTKPVPNTETVSLRQARNRILAEDVVALRSVPPTDNAAVDGYAVRFEDLAANGETRLDLVGRAAAGHSFGGEIASGQAVRIFTGASMPTGADTVLMQEDCRADAQAVTIPAGIKRGANLRRAGEDVESGSVVMSRGRRLRPQDLGLAAAVGRQTLTVYRTLRAAVFSTGDELHEPAADLPPGRICDANRYALTALLEGLGVAVTDLGILGDRLETIRDALDGASESHDLVVTSGGMSVGEEDHVKAAVEALGRLHFWQIAIKPGRPVGLGQVNGVPFIGLPGNPVAMVVTFLRIARPMILRLAGCVDVTPHVFRVPADFAMTKKAGRREWIRAQLAAAAGGGLVAKRFPRQGSGILSSLVDADGLIEIPEDITEIAPGTLVDFLPFSEVSL